MQRLFKSLQSQINLHFIWYIMDDGSTDDSWEYIRRFKEQASFEVQIQRLSVNNRSRAINMLREMVETEYVTHIDDDDIAIPETVENCYQLINRFPVDTDQAKYCAIAGILLDLNGEPMFQLQNMPLSQGYIDASNLERYSLRYRNTHLSQDKREIYKTKILNLEKYPVVDGEVFADDNYVNNKIAERGYKIRWTNIPLAKREYRDEGITKSGIDFVRRNPRSLRISTTYMHKVLPFPRNYTCLGLYYRVMKDRNDGIKNSIIQCADEVNASSLSMITGILLKKLGSGLKRLLSFYHFS